MGQMQFGVQANNHNQPNLHGTITTLIGVFVTSMAYNKLQHMTTTGETVTPDSQLLTPTKYNKSPLSNANDFFQGFKRIYHYI